MHGLTGGYGQRGGWLLPGPAAIDTRQKHSLSTLGKAAERITNRLIRTRHDRQVGGCSTRVVRPVLCSVVFSRDVPVPSHGNAGGDREACHPAMAPSWGSGFCQYQIDRSAVLAPAGGGPTAASTPKAAQAARTTRESAHTVGFMIPLAIFPGWSATAAYRPSRRLPVELPCGCLNDNRYVHSPRTGRPCKRELQ
jgi:hypothetical protein